MYYRPKVFYPSQLPHVFKEIEKDPTIKALDLSGFRIGWQDYNRTFDTKVVNEVVDAIPDTITHLKLGLNFAEMSAQQFHDVLNRLSRHPNLISLDLADSDLGRRSKDELVLIFSGLPRTLQELGLADNYLGWLNSKELLPAFKCFPPQLLSLNLSGHNFTTLAEGFDNLMAILPATLRHLSLQQNFQLSMQNGELPKIPGLPAQLESLDISGFHIDSNEYELLLPLLKNILPPSLKTLHAYNLSSYIISPNVFKTFLQSLPESLSGLCLSLAHKRQYR